MKEKSKVRIFISYRRKGGIDTARWLHDQLRDRDYNVFLDMEGLRSGAFNTALYSQIKNSDVFLMVLTKDCLKRCSSKNDWVRQELSYAFRCGLNVIPVMKEDFVWPNRLPQDISPIRNCQGLTISYQFFEAFLDKLEEYILNEPETLSYIPEPEPSVEWPKYAIAGVALAALLAGVFLLGRGFTQAPTPSGGTSSNQSNTASDHTDPPSIEGQQTYAAQDLGNTTGNQCNGSIAAINQYSVYSKGRFLNSLDEWRYHYGTKTHTLYVRRSGEEAKPIMEDQELVYALFSRDWVYYAVPEANGCTLYRAPRPEGAAHVTGGELVATGISSENSIMIDGAYAYYWRHNMGIYRLNLTTLEETFLYEHDATWSADTIGTSGNWVYVMTEASITRVHMDDRRRETVFTLADHFPDEKLTAANVDGSWIYFAVTDLGTDPYQHNARVYRMHTDSSSMERIFVADTSVCQIQRICITDANVHFDMECGEGDYCHYAIQLDTWKSIISDMAHTQPLQETPGVTVGNTVTNLCNHGAIAVIPGNAAVYRLSKNIQWFNLFEKPDTAYCFDSSERSISVTWTENEKFQSSTLLKNVICHYLYVTPDWLYCVLEKDGVSTLYRAQNNMEEHTIGELTPILTDIYASPNRLAIHGGKIYFWRKDKGLFTARTDGSGETLLFDNNGQGKCNGWITFHVDDEHLYFFVSSYGIYRVNLESAELKKILDTDELDGKVAHAVAVDNKIAYVIRHITDDVVTAPDELWVMNEDGTDAKQLYVSSESMHIQLLNANFMEIYLKIVEEGVTTMYRISSYGGELLQGSTYD